METGEESIKLNLDFKKDKDTLRIVCSDACTCDSKMKVLMLPNTGSRRILASAQVEAVASI